MLDMFFLMISVAMNAAPDSMTAVTSHSTSSASVVAIAPSDQSAVQQPTEDQTVAAVAPVFLAPSVAPAAASPAFLAPAAKPALVAEPQTPSGRFTTATEVKPILNATKGNWILVREFDGKDLLYVTHLWSWRCGLLEMRVGINGNDPEVWPLPDCHLDQPSPAAILDGDGLPYVEFGLGSIAMVEIEITYDDLSTDSAIFNRQGMLIP